MVRDIVPIIPVGYKVLYYLLDHWLGHATGGTLNTIVCVCVTIL